MVSKFATEVVKFFDEEGTRTGLMEYFDLENLPVLEVTREVVVADSEFNTATDCSSISTVQTQVQPKLPLELPPDKIDDTNRTDLNTTSKLDLVESEASIKQV